MKPRLFSLQALALVVGLLLLAGGVAFGQPVSVATASDTAFVGAGGSGDVDLYFPITRDAGSWEGRILTDEVGQGPADSILAGWRPVWVTSSDTLALLPWTAAAIDTNTELSGSANWLALVTGSGYEIADSSWRRLLPAVPSDTSSPLPLLRSVNSATSWEGVQLRVRVYGSENDSVLVRGEWRWRRYD